MIAIVPAATCLQAIFCEPLVGLIQPFGSSGIVRETQPERDTGHHSDDAFDDEQPSEAFESSSSIRVADAKGNTIEVSFASLQSAGNIPAAKCSCKVAERDDESDADCSLVMTIPDRYHCRS